MYRFFVQGVVQGVGFRPYIYRKAKEYSLVGTVKNIGSGVEIIINDKDFMKKLTDLPPLAKITDHTDEEIETKEYTDFSILKSTESEGETILPQDIFTCKDCLRELKDRDNRRSNYYFITCTNCGPRFSMIIDYPYDRPLTSMRHFEMCDECRKEYANPLDRRYHAQTIACKDCGPKLLLKQGSKAIHLNSDLETIKRAAELIKSGEILSIKGVGGFHLCSLTDDSAVEKVRKLLNRSHKPFAVMVKDLGKAKEIASISEKEAGLLQSPERPIMVLRKKDREQFSGISELDSIGIMLPYTALHYLMFDFIEAPLLMTSCNIPGEPVAVKEKIGKYFLTHEREIINRCDDSVLKIIAGRAFFLRRSRGYTPLPVKLPISVSETIALGAELNNVIAVSKRNNCFLSQYLGNTSKLATAEFLKETADTFIRLTRLKPRIIACDMHPSYFSTSLARELADKHNASLIQVQHHKAHIASVAAEHELSDYVGIAMDGLGFGEDGNIWGGEVFDVRNGTDFRRIGHLEEQPQLGGDSATIYPKKMLFGLLARFLDETELLKLAFYDEKETKLYLNLLDAGFNVPQTTSAGRILDAASSLLGLCDKRTYDGRPAMLLESMATEPLEFEPVYGEEDGRRILMTTPLFKHLLENLEEGKGRLAATVQTYLAKGLFDIARREKKQVVLSGGVAYNRMISDIMLKNGVLMNRDIPSGDGGICFGQSYLANLITES
ncbi:MAG: carbamoyltransferase HypF [Candidatus Micrarchaeota archaeon]